MVKGIFHPKGKPSSPVKALGQQDDKKKTPKPKTKNPNSGNGQGNGPKKRGGGCILM